MAYPQFFFTYPARVRRVVDGDTIDFDLDLGFYLITAQRVRLLDVDTPERGQKGWTESTNFVRDWLFGEAIKDLQWKTEWPFIIETAKADSFGRWLGKVFTAAPSRECLNEQLLASGLAVPWRRK